MGSYLDYKITLDEAFDLLPLNEQQNLHLLLEKSKTKPNWYATNNFKYAYNGLSVCRLNFSAKDTWRINLTVAKFEYLDDTLSRLSKDLQKFFFFNLRACKHCNPTHGNGRQVIILGNEYFVCAEPEIELCNSTISDIQMLCEIINIRKENIKQIKNLKN